MKKLANFLMKIFSRFWDKLPVLVSEICYALVPKKTYYIKLFLKN